MPEEKPEEEIEKEERPEEELTDLHRGLARFIRADIEAQDILNAIQRGVAEYTGVIKSATERMWDLSRKLADFTDAREGNLDILEKLLKRHPEFFKRIRESLEARKKKKFEEVVPSPRIPEVPEFLPEEELPEEEEEEW